MPLEGVEALRGSLGKADAKFVADVKGKISGIEGKWVQDAQAKGLKDAARVLAEFRAEIAKASK